MSKKSNITNINKKKFKIDFDIGIVIIILIFIYMLVNVISYLTSTHIAIYEVQEGTILTDNAYTAFAVRAEDVTFANSAGYVQYFVNDGDKIAVGNPIYSFSSTEKSTSGNNSNSLQSSEISILANKTEQFNSVYNPMDFNQVYNFSYDCKSTILDSKNDLYLSDDLILSSSIYQKASIDGIIGFTIDGYEDVTKGSFKSEYLNRSAYTKQDVRVRQKTAVGDPLYKTITDDIWYLYLEVSDETARALYDVGKINVRFKKDNQRVSASINLNQLKGQNLLCLELEDSVMRYANERYLDIELILDNQSGLKIPKTAIVEKEFYAIPNIYITKGGNTNDSGVYVKTKIKKGYSSVFTPLEIYKSDKKYSYVPLSSFEKDTVLLKPESTDTYQVEKTKKIQGVYNINKGYTVFRLIDVLLSNDTYVIAREGQLHGVNNYDHIVLEASKVSSDEIVFQ